MPIWRISFVQWGRDDRMWHQVFFLFESSIISLSQFLNSRSSNERFYGSHHSEGIAFLMTESSFLKVAYLGNFSLHSHIWQIRMTLSFSICWMSLFQRKSPSSYPSLSSRFPISRKIARLLDWLFHLDSQIHVITPSSSLSYQTHDPPLPFRGWLL